MEKSEHPLTSQSNGRLTATDRSEAQTGWAERHNTAIGAPQIGTLRGSERPIVALFYALDDYACQHNRRYDSLIGDDSFLGPAWTSALRGLRTLLNGETGRLDCGTLDAAILQLAFDHGVSPDEL